MHTYALFRVSLALRKPVEDTHDLWVKRVSDLISSILLSTWRITYGLGYVSIDRLLGYVDGLRAVDAHSSITYNDSPFVEWGDYLHPIHVLADYKTVKRVYNYYLRPILHSR